MADQTLGAVGSLLGYLGKLVKEEGKLLATVESDIEFIKDEMDSMNGFLLHLNKTTTPHDDQVRAWMKQVRDVTYVADDYIKLYMRHLAPTPEQNRWCCSPLLDKFLRCVPDEYIVYCNRNAFIRHDLSKKIHALKDRVHQVGKRRLRYAVELPKWEIVESPPQVSQDRKMKEAREKFLAALEDGLYPFQDAVRMLPRDHHRVVKKCLQLLGDGHVAIIKMLLRSLYAHPYGTKEVENLLEKVQQGDRDDVTKQVMIFCYSKLTLHYKSCLQYLTTFEEEESISRTCLVRRWLAEGLVAKDEQQEGLEEVRSMEEAGERCFDELLFTGFLSRAPGYYYPRNGGLKLKSCVLDGLVKKFILDMSKNENFVAELPTHLRHQLHIRKMSRREPPQEQHKLSSICGITRIKAVASNNNSMAVNAGGDNNSLLLRHPMDEIVALLKGLPKEYRLNVLDLGGCMGLTTSHLKKICEQVPSLKYLSLRKTNISQLPKEMNKLLHLETLDIRDTHMVADAMKGIILQELKHLLAGHIVTDGRGNEAAVSKLSTVVIPPKMGKTTEILRHVQIENGRAAEIQLLHVSTLERLRKLGVVLDGREENITLLLTTIARRSETLRSLSVWITPPPPEHIAIAGGDVFVTLESKGDTSNGAPVLFSHPSKLESLNLKCFKGRNCKIGNIPDWIKRLQNLSKITLRHSLLTREGLSELGKMKSLRCLKLCNESYIEAEVTVKKGEFDELRLLLVDKISHKMTKLVFEEGAAPRLEKIVWNFDTTMTLMGITVDNISGITNLKMLKELKINSLNISIPPQPREWKDIATGMGKLWKHVI